MRYQEITLYYYSGTGNSYRVTAWMADVARAEGSAVTVLPIASARPREVRAEESSLLGVVMPTHGFTAPWPVLRFALELPRGRGKHAIVVATRAGAKIGSRYAPGFEGSATSLVAAILALKGYVVRGTVAVDMPSNWIELHPGLSPSTVAGIVARAKPKATAFASAILAGQRRFGSWIVVLLGLLLLPVSLAYLLLARFFLAKLLFASEQCTGCGLCAQHCPNGAIEMRGSSDRAIPFWTFRCESCMRCMAYCPPRAVEANWALGVAAYLVSAAIPTAAVVAWLAARSRVLAVVGWTPGWVLGSIWPIPILGLLYRVVYPLLRKGWVNRLFTRATPTHYYRRYHEPKTTLEELG